MKKCRDCGIEKPLTEFYSDGTRAKSRRPECKRCHCENRKLSKNDKLYRFTNRMLTSWGRPV